MENIDNLAWVAGIFEGEGCIAFTGKNSVCLTIGMTDLDIIDRIHIATGEVGNRYEQSSSRAKTLYVWQLSRKGLVVPFLESIMPWLGLRRSEKAIGALERLTKIPNEGFCYRGHRRAGDNLYIAPGGQRQCRECQKINEKNRAAKRYLSRRPGRHPANCVCPTHIVKT